MKRKLLFILVLLLSAFSFVNALSSVTEVYPNSNLDSLNSNKNLGFLYFYKSLNLSQSEIAFELKFDKNIKKTDEFILDTYYSNETWRNTNRNDNSSSLLISSGCKQYLTNKNNVLYRKITCPIENKGSGKYIYVAKILRNENGTKKIIESFSTIRFYSKLYGVSLFFNDLPKNKTEVIIQIDKNDSNFELMNFIPKTVINNLTTENENKYIISYNKFKIINSDPLIAWDIEKSPVKINYTINKKISFNDKEKFQVEIKKNNSGFEYLEYFLVFLILLIIVVLVKPIFLKKKK